MRTINDLFVDRFGAQPIQSDCLYEEKDLEKIKNNLGRPIVMELFKEEEVMCLLKSIPIKEILEVFSSEAIFKKVAIHSEKIMWKMKIP